MKLRVKLFGSHRQAIPHYDPAKGIEIEIPDGSQVRDLLVHLNISNSKAAVVSVNHRIAGRENELKDGDQVNVIQQAFGG